MPKVKMTGVQMKEANRNRVFCYIYKSTQLSKQDIAYGLGMSLPTVTQNLKELMEMQVIREVGVFESTGGRKARAISVNKKAKYSIGLDITRNHVGIVIADFAGEMVNNKRIRCPFVNKEEYFKGIGDIIEEFIEMTKINRERILGVGIAVPAILSADKETLTYSRVLDFFSGNVSRFAKYIPYKCSLCNDANAAGFAELWNTDFERDMVYISLSNSVGGSILLNKMIYYGENQRSAEFGHMTIVPDGKTCYCGQKGCADAYLSANVLSEYTEGNIENFFKGLKSGNQELLAVWSEYKKHLSVTANNLRMLFDCDVIIGGYVGSCMEEYIDEIRMISSKRNTFETENNYVKVCKYKREATAMGAALMYIDKFVTQI